MAAITATVVAAGAAAYSANRQSKAAKSAAKAQTQAAQSANDTQLRIFNQQRADNEPFRQAGLTGLSEYMALLGLPGVQQQFSYGQPAGGNGFQTQGWGQPISGAPAQPAQTQGYNAATQQSAFDRFRATPGYQFGLDEGIKATEASAAARGGLNSGATLKALMRYGQNYADQQGYTPYMNSLASLWGGAQQANSQNASAGQNYANAFGQNLNTAAAARASSLQSRADTNSQFAGALAGGVNGFLANRGGSIYGGATMGSGPFTQYPVTGIAGGYTGSLGPSNGFNWNFGGGY